MGSCASSPLRRLLPFITDGSEARGVLKTGLRTRPRDLQRVRHVEESRIGYLNIQRASGGSSYWPRVRRPSHLICRTIALFCAGMGSCHPLGLWEAETGTRGRLLLCAIGYTCAAVSGTRSLDQRPGRTRRPRPRTSFLRSLGWLLATQASGGTRAQSVVKPWARVLGPRPGWVGRSGHRTVGRTSALSTEKFIRARPGQSHQVLMVLRRSLSVQSWHATKVRLGVLNGSLHQASTWVFWPHCGVVVNPKPKYVMVCRKYLEYLMGSVL